MLFDDKVLCPAHAAGFSIVTGEPEQAPGCPTTRTAAAPWTLMVIITVVKYND